MDNYLANIPFQNLLAMLEDQKNVICGQGMGPLDLAGKKVKNLLDILRLFHTFHSLDI
jgi:hypothetical protein